MTKTWTALVLAAGRGPNDPMAKAYGVSHKCALPVNGVPMLRRVVNALLRVAIAFHVGLAKDNRAFS